MNLDIGPKTSKSTEILNDTAVGFRYRPRSMSDAARLQSARTLGANPSFFGIFAVAGFLSIISLIAVGVSGLPGILVSAVVLSGFAATVASRAGRNAIFWSVPVAAVLLNLALFALGAADMSLLIKIGVIEVIGVAAVGALSSSFGETLVVAAVAVLSSILGLIAVAAAVMSFFS